MKIDCKLYHVSLKAYKEQINNSTWDDPLSYQIIQGYINHPLDYLFSKSAIEKPVPCRYGCNSDSGTCFSRPLEKGQCTDPDGEDFKDFSAVTITYPNGASKIREDKCKAGSNTLLEATCDNQGNDTFVEHLCVAGCFNAACGSCKQFRGTKGYVNIYDNEGNVIEKGEDRCFDGDPEGRLFPQKCYDASGKNGNSMCTMKAYCRSPDANSITEGVQYCNYGCKGGRCIPQDCNLDGVCNLQHLGEETCVDSDDADFYTRGETRIDYPNGGFNLEVDFCNSDEILIEYVCGTNREGNVSRDSIWHTCPRGCKHGVCIKSDDSLGSVTYQIIRNEYEDSVTEDRSNNSSNDKPKMKIVEHVKVSKSKKSAIQTRLKPRVCRRVFRRFTGNIKMINRINRRLEKRFGFECKEMDLSR